MNFSLLVHLALYFRWPGTFRGVYSGGLGRAVGLGLVFQWPGTFRDCVQRKWGAEGLGLVFPLAGHV